MKKHSRSLGAIFAVVVLVSSMVQLPTSAEQSTNSCAIMPEGLVYWLKAEGNADDYLGSHDGIIHGLVTFSEGMVGDAFVFNGGSNYVSIAQSLNIPAGAAPRTLEMWMYSEIGTWQSDLHTSFWTGTTLNKSAFFVDFETHPTMQFATWDEDLWFTSSVPKVGWFHAAFVYDGETTLNAYINGELAGSLELTAPLTTSVTETLVGSGYHSAGQLYFLGKLDEVTLFNRALTQDEIASIALAGESGKCINSAPTADAGPDQLVKTSSLVTLDGSLSSDPEGNLPLSYLWSQVSGPPVPLDSYTIVNPTFLAPVLEAEIVFSLQVVDSFGALSEPDQVNISIEDYNYYIPNCIKE